jgi:hypothetical protein
VTEITKIEEIKSGQRYSVNPTAFLAALILAPLVVTALSFWTVIGLFALAFGALPYLVIGTPVLLWAVGRIKPSFGEYAPLGFLGNGAMVAFILVVMALNGSLQYGAGAASVFAGFGFVFAPLYAGAFGSLYAAFHPNIRILQTV